MPRFSTTLGLNLKVNRATVIAVARDNVNLGQYYQQKARQRHQHPCSIQRQQTTCQCVRLVDCLLRVTELTMGSPLSACSRLTVSVTRCAAAGKAPTPENELKARGAANTCVSAVTQCWGVLRKKNLERIEIATSNIPFSAKNI